MSNEQFELLVFESISTQEGDYCTGRDEQGRKVVCKVESVKWWAHVLLLIAPLVPFYSGDIVMFAVQRGITIGDPQFRSEAA